MRDDFFTRKTCQRCGGSLEGGRIMSMLNTDCLCLACAEKETNHERYQEARAAELRAVQAGNFNYKGLLNGQKLEP